PPHHNDDDNNDCDDDNNDNPPNHNDHHDDDHHDDDHHDNDHHDKPPHHDDNDHHDNDKPCDCSNDNNKVHRRADDQDRVEAKIQALTTALPKPVVNVLLDVKEKTYTLIVEKLKNKDNLSSDISNKLKAAIASAIDSISRDFLNNEIRDQSRSILQKLCPSDSVCDSTINSDIFESATAGIENSMRDLLGDIDSSLLDSPQIRDLQLMFAQPTKSLGLDIEEEMNTLKREIAAAQPSLMKSLGV
ncbi:hypothetical protein BGW38_006412, partial [Lunasporangiospora selenospora]